MSGLVFVDLGGWISGPCLDPEQLLAPDPIAALVREFPGWQISIRPAGLALCGAYWQSGDGRSRRYIAAPTPVELLAALRAKTGPTD
jgi:hypothetical protein